MVINEHTKRSTLTLPNTIPKTPTCISVNSVISIGLAKVKLFLVTATRDLARKCCSCSSNSTSVPRVSNTRELLTRTVPRILHKHFYFLAFLAVDLLFRLATGPLAQHQVGDNTQSLSFLPKIFRGERKPGCHERKGVRPRQGPASD